MSKQSRELEKRFKEIIGDIFDNFDKYTNEEKGKSEKRTWASSRFK
ncbi:MAG: hypothetical protein V8Q90_05320 [Bacilli bacterium]